MGKCRYLCSTCEHSNYSHFGSADPFINPKPLPLDIPVPFLNAQNCFHRSRRALITLVDTLAEMQLNTTNNSSHHYQSHARPNNHYTSVSSCESAITNYPQELTTHKFSCVDARNSSAGAVALVGGVLVLEVRRSVVCPVSATTAAVAQFE